MITLPIFQGGKQLAMWEVTVTLLGLTFPVFPTVFGLLKQKSGALLLVLPPSKAAIA